jgi:hypothetical protein
MTDTYNQLNIPKVNYDSHEWNKLEQWAQEELRRARVRNDAPSLSESETALIRGEILVLKKILGMRQNASREVVVGPDY